MPLPPRPRMRSDDDQIVSEYVRMRESVLLGEADEEFRKFMEGIAGPEIAASWGVPDDALSPLASQTRQLTTPGLYGRTPDFRPAAGSEAHAEALQAARWWIRAQTLQFLVVGIGAYWRRIVTAPALAGDGVEIVDDLVTPADVAPQWDAYGRLVGIWHLRVRDGRWTWDVYSIAGGVGVYEVREARQDGTLGDDLSSRYLETADGIRGALSGDRYPFARPDGAPFLPWVLYTAELPIGGGAVPTHWRRATYRGTFRAVAHWTYTSRSALFATGEHTLLGGVDVASMPGVRVVRGDGGLDDIPADPVWTMSITPGSITALPIEEGAQLQSVQIGPGANLPNLLQYSSAYTMLLATGDGLHPTDATRQSANPSSGVALEIQASSRREFAAQVEPIFRYSDEQALQISAWLLIRAGLQIAESGWTLTYYTIPLSPQEQGDLRDDLDWQVEHGHLSRIEAHRRARPGITRDQAIAELISVAVDEALLDRQIAEALAAQGLEPPPPPTNPGGNVPPLK